MITVCRHKTMVKRTKVQTLELFDAQRHSHDKAGGLFCVKQMPRKPQAKPPAATATGPKDMKETYCLSFSLSFR